MATFRRRKRKICVVCLVSLFSLATFLLNSRESLTPISDIFPQNVKYSLEVKKPAQRQSYAFHVLGELEVISTWYELTELSDCFRKTNGRLGVKPCPVKCPGFSHDLTLYLSDELGDAEGKDALILGVSPFTLIKRHFDLLHYPVSPKEQLVVYYSMESPLRNHKWSERISRLPFHIDMTYHNSSNIHLPYGESSKPVQDGDRKNITGNVNLREKSGLIAWMGSNCAKEVFWPRMEFINELKKYIKLDIYGKCGNLTCTPRLSPTCNDMLKKYKFYIAFENSECDQYVTEKFWSSALANHVIPVVYGPRKRDYLNLAPPNSFIHVGDYESIEELATYIRYLDENDVEYLKYFEWMDSYRIEQLYPKLELSYFCHIIPHFSKVDQMEVRRIHTSTWFNSCRNKISKRFEPADVSALSSWEPW